MKVQVLSPQPEKKMKRREFIEIFGLSALIFPSLRRKQKKDTHKNRLLIGNCTKCWQSQYRFPFGEDDSAVPLIIELHSRKWTCSCGGSLDKWIIINEFGIIIDVDIKTYQYAYPKVCQRIKVCDGGA